MAENKPCMVLWLSPTAHTCYDSETYDSEEEARAAIVDFHKRFPWNTYLLVEVKDSVLGDKELKPRPTITYHPVTHD